GVWAFYDHFELFIVLEPICFVGALVKRDPFIIIVAAMALTIMLVFGFHMARRNSNPIDKAGAQMKGQPAPEFTLQSLDGKTVRLADFRGKGVLLKFWATWCQPCKIEMRWLVELQKQYGPQGLQVDGVGLEGGRLEDID